MRNFRTVSSTVSDMIVIFEDNLRKENCSLKTTETGNVNSDPKRQKVIQKI